MNLTYLFRSSGTGHSIESLFGTLQEVVEKQSGVPVKAVHLPFISQGIRSIWRNLRFVTRLNADVFHITGDIHYAALALPSSQTILTIHDCVTLKTNLRRPVRFAFFWLFWYYLPIRRAAVVTSVSEKTRQELIQYVGSVARKVTVVPNCYDPACLYQPMFVLKDSPQLLQIGTAPHKNLSNLIAAIRGIDCILSIVGPLSEKIIAELDQHSITYRHYVNLRRDEIIQLFRDCTIVTFISTYEGFGMPILEANAIGRPVITSNLSPMCDVAAGSAHLVNPTNVTSIRQGILQLIHDSTYRQCLIDAGLKNVQRYSAVTVADQYITLYHQLQSSAKPVSPDYFRLR
ncbi:glycosyltransferase family 1 protein [Spirosoma sp. KNUC1025]|uniref:glycosyltransferase family 4 protein n=1 Tax=Spirosoma sp. KNUC1025 TaxID=2894082 RepID=UPI0038665CE9|nr:glycosyltransferase family 4 protein [Spirosoma sp. KNUC1025]